MLARPVRDVDGSARRAEEIRRRGRAQTAARGVEEEEGGAAEAPVHRRAHLARRRGGIFTPVNQRRIGLLEEGFVRDRRVRRAGHADVPAARRARGGPAMG